MTQVIWLRIGCAPNSRLPGMLPTGQHLGQNATDAANTRHATGHPAAGHRRPAGTAKSAGHADTVYRSMHARSTMMLKGTRAPPWGRRWAAPQAQHLPRHPGMLAGQGRTTAYGLYHRPMSCSALACCQPDRPARGQRIWPGLLAIMASNDAATLQAAGLYVWEARAKGVAHMGAHGLSCHMPLWGGTCRGHACIHAPRKNIMHILTGRRRQRTAALQALYALQAVLGRPPFGSTKREAKQSGFQQRAYGQFGANQAPPLCTHDICTAHPHPRAPLKHRQMRTMN